MNWSWKSIFFILIAVAVLALVTFTVGCGGGGGGQPSQGTVQNPIPSIASISPTYVAAGSTPQTLTLNGAGFVASSSVTFNGVAHATTLVISQQLTITLSQSDLANPGSYPIAVTNPQPGGGTSASTTFSVWSNFTDRGLGIELNIPPNFISYRSTDPADNQVVFTTPPAQSEADVMLVVAISDLPQGESLMQAIEDGGIDASSISSVNSGGYTYLYCYAPGQGDGTWSYATILSGSQVITFSTPSSSFASSSTILDIISSLSLLSH